MADDPSVSPHLSSASSEPSASADGASAVPATDLTHARGESLARTAGAGSPGVVEARPPRGPLKVIAAMAAFAAPLAILAVVQGDVALGLAALVSAAWAGSVVYVGWMASSVADDDGVTVSWLRRSERVRWEEVRRVVVDRSGPGRARRGARLLLVDARSLPWTPWVPFFWFARAAADRSAADLEAVAYRAGSGSGSGPVPDPAAPGPGE